MADPGRGPHSAAAEGGEIRAIADQLLMMFDELRSVEEQKRRESLGSDAFVALAEAAEAQGRLVFRWTGLQLEIARDAARRRGRGELAPDVSIEEIQPRRLDRILAAWREAQMRLEIAKPGTPEAAEAADRIERLHDEYRAAASGQADEAAAFAKPSYAPADRPPSDR
jgi:hypothetical protein